MASKPESLRARLQNISPLNPAGLRACQITTINNLEVSFKADRPRALMQMATGPLLWPIHARYRSLLFELIDLMNIGSATQDRSLLDALAIVRKHRHARGNEVLDPVDLSFASLRWQSFIRKRGNYGFDRRALEVCVFIHLADALQAGDIYVVDAEDFADYRAQLLPWSECEPRIAGYCAALGIPEHGMDFAAALKAELTSLAEQVDAGYPQQRTKHR
jgi:hypothetical protein